MFAGDADVDVVEAKAVDTDFHLVPVPVQIHGQLAVGCNTPKTQRTSGEVTTKEPRQGEVTTKEPHQGELTMKEPGLLFLQIPLEVLLVVLP